MTTLLNNRQQLAEAMTRELRGLKGGDPESAIVWVVSPLPLADDRKLRLQIADIAKDRVINKIRSWGYEPIYVGVAPRFDIMGITAASAYEVDLPRERQPIVDDRKIYGEVAERKKSPSEAEAVLRHLGLKK